MPYKLIALDIDGTIRDREQPVSQRTIEAVQRARTMGAVVTVVTGRMFQSALKAVGDLERRERGEAGIDLFGTEIK